MPPRGNEQLHSKSKYQVLKSFWWTKYEQLHIFLNVKRRETWKRVIVAIVYDVADFICFGCRLGFFNFSVLGLYYFNTNNVNYIALVHYFIGCNYYAFCRNNRLPFSRKITGSCFRLFVFQAQLRPFDFSQKITINQHKWLSSNAN